MKNKWVAVQRSHAW